MKVKTVLLLIVLQLIASHIYHYKKAVVEDLNWEYNLVIGNSNITLMRNNQTGLLEATGKYYSNEDFARAIGYAHAKDRLSQMNQQRWVAHGRASECFIASEDLIKLDISMRELGISAICQDIIDNRLRNETLDYLYAYSEGVNYFLKERSEYLSSLRYFQLFTGAWINYLVPIESALVDSCAYEEWTVLDTMVIAPLITYLGLAETQSLAEKFLLQSMISGVPLDSLKELFPHLSGVTPELVEIYKSIHLSKPIIPSSIPFLSTFPAYTASNNWAVGSSKSESGKPLQCNDPHLDLARLPAVWYEFLYRTTDDDGQFLFGISVPGFPAIQMGRSKYISYGLTYGYMDMIDFFVEEVKDGKLRKGNEYIDFNQRNEILRTKDGNEIQLTFLSSGDGIRILELDSYLSTDVLSADGKVKIKDGRYLSRAFSWSLFEDVFFSIFFPARGKSVRETKEIMSNTPVSTNYLITDLQGNIGYQQTGILPKRGNRNSGLYPVEGWIETNEWKGWVHSNYLNSFDNPPEGFIVTANDNWQAKGDMPVSISLPLNPYRRQRGDELMKSKAKLSSKDMKEFQSDVYSKQAEKYFTHIKSLLFHSKIDPKVKKVFSEWDMRYSPESEGPVYFEAFLRNVYTNVFGELFGREVITHMLQSRVFNLCIPAFDEVIFHTNNTEKWFHKGREQLLLDALIDLNYTGQLYGDIHQVNIRNNYFAKSLSYWFGFSKNPFPIQGGRQTLSTSIKYPISQHKEVWFAPSWRYITDMAKDYVETQLPGGVSARRFSGLYDNGFYDYFFANVYKRVNFY